MREILIADGTCKAKNGLRADRGGATVGARGVGPAVDHGVTDFNAGGIAVENDAADFVFSVSGPSRKIPCRSSSVP